MGLFDLLHQKDLETQKLKLDARERAIESREQDLSERDYQLAQKELLMQNRESRISSIEQNLSLRQSELETKAKNIPSEIQKGISDQLPSFTFNRFRQALKKNANRFFHSIPIYEDIFSYDFLNNPRLYSALTESISSIGDYQISVTMVGETGEKYIVSLKSCTCPDFQFRKSPCKHMYRLAIDFGLLSLLDSESLKPIIEDLTDAYSRSKSQKEEAQKSIAALRRIEKEHQSVLNTIEKKQRSISNSIDLLLKDTGVQHPWLSSALADIDLLYEKGLEKELRHKKRPAIKAADAVSKISAEKHDLSIKLKNLEYRLSLYSAMFPWIESADDVPEMAYNEIVSLCDSSDSESEKRSLLSWLSPEEYDKLPSSEKYQLALDRWRTSPKSDWQIGINFERFVGYQYEMQGCRVIYNGALSVKQDYGRDLIVDDGGSIKIIQCKRWSSFKEVHEKHVFQLYGSTVSYRIDHPELIAFPILITTCPLSEKAKQFAESLKVECKENYPISEIDTYPMIKCNISKTGEKIYHLPFDQQYDRVQINISAGECYVSTVSEAEVLGFRRAKKHHVS